MGGSRGGEVRGWDSRPPEKSQKVIGFLKNSGTDHPREAIASRGRSIGPSMKYLADEKKVIGTHPHPLRNFLDPSMVVIGSLEISDTDHPQEAIAGLRKFWIDQDFRVEHWHMMCIMSM